MKLVARADRSHSFAATAYSYAGTGDANPDAVTQIANGIATSSFAYDNNGNLTSAGTSTFSWDYRNRMTQAVTQGSTSTYGYDDQLNRVSQTVGGVTTIYPNKFYSVASSTVSGALAPPCIELPDPEDTRPHFGNGSHIWLAI